MQYDDDTQFLHANTINNLEISFLKPKKHCATSNNIFLVMDLC